MAELDEDIVDEIASRRLTFDDLVATIRECPTGAISGWAYRLWVGVPMFNTRLRNLSQQELDAIDAIKTEAQFLTRTVRSDP